MKKYSYRDNKTKTILFESVEEDDVGLTEVDVKFEAHTGIDPIKAMHIGCQILPIK